MDLSNTTRLDYSGPPLRQVDMGGDLSAPRSASKPIYLGRYRHYEITISWPATPDGGTNAQGAFSIKENGGLGDSTWDEIPACAEADFVNAQPNGSGDAGAFTVTDIETTRPFVTVEYTPVSGGVGVVPTVYFSVK